MPFAAHERDQHYVRQGMRVIRQKLGHIGRLRQSPVSIAKIGCW